MTIFVYMIFTWLMAAVKDFLPKLLRLASFLASITFYFYTSFTCKYVNK